MIFRKLKELSYDALQELESTTDNEYIKQSAKILLLTSNYGENGFSRKLK